MKGLVLKDLLTIRSTIKTYIIVFSLYGVIGIISNSIAFGASFYCIFAAMLPITAMGYDERSKFNPYALTMPVTTRDIVFAKYILGIITALVGALFSTVVVLFDKNGGLLDRLLIPITGFLLAVIFQALVTPIMFKLGVEKGRIILMLIFILPTILILGLSKLAPNLLLLLFELPIKILVITSISAILLIYISSIFISIKIVQKKAW